MNITKLDTQQVEIVGRNLLVSLFTSDGVEVAMPQRDRGIDVIAYQDLTDTGNFVAVPVQLKAFSQRGFGVHKKYAKFPGLLIAYVWYASEPLKSSLYILSYSQAKSIADELGWTNTPSWQDGGSYITNKPSTQLVNILEKYKYAPGKLAKAIGNTAT